MINDFCMFNKRIWKVVNESKGVSYIESPDGRKPKSQIVPTNALVFTANETMKASNIVRR